MPRSPVAQLSGIHVPMTGVAGAWKPTAANIAAVFPAVPSLLV